MRKRPDRNLSDLTPTLAEYILHHAMEHIAITRDCYPDDPNAEAIGIIWKAIAEIREMAPQWAWELRK